MNLKYMKVLLFEISYKKKWTFSPYSLISKDKGLFDTNQTNDFSHVLKHTQTETKSIVFSALLPAHAITQSLKKLSVGV